MLKLFDAIFHEDKLIKAEFSLAEDIRRERVLRIAPLFNELKSYLDKLEKNLEKEEEPELLKAVKYALTEYPCMLRCLEDGSLDLSNNICERQIRRIAKYRNNSYFVCSPESGVRFARLMSHFANIRKHFPGSDEEFLLMEMETLEDGIAEIEDVNNWNRIVMSTIKNSPVVEKWLREQFNN